MACAPSLLYTRVSYGPGAPAPTARIVATPTSAGSQVRGGGGDTSNTAQTWPRRRRALPPPPQTCAAPNNLGQPALRQPPLLLFPSPSAPASQSSRREFESQPCCGETYHVSKTSRPVTTLERPNPTSTVMMLTLYGTFRDTPSDIPAVPRQYIKYLCTPILSGSPNRTGTRHQIHGSMPREQILRAEMPPALIRSSSTAPHLRHLSKQSAVALGMPQSSCL